MKNHGLFGFGGEEAAGADAPGAQLLSSPRGEVYYWVTPCPEPGAGWLVLTHGLGMDHTVFDALAGELSASFNVVTWDLPLHGMSDEYGEFSFLNCANDIREILNAVGADSAVVIGHCIGGCAAQAFGVVFPEYCRGLVLVDTFPFGEELCGYGDFQWLDKLTGAMRVLPSRLFGSALAGFFSATPEGERALRPVMSRQNTACVADALAISMTSLCKEGAPAFAFPVLDIVGENDRLGPIKKLNRSAAETCGYDFAAIPRAGHTPFVDNPAQFSLVLGDFLAGLR
jgi:pimeloyl-ACP methyl ester carboxylesterase